MVIYEFECLNCYHDQILPDRWKDGWMNVWMGWMIGVAVYCQVCVTFMEKCHQSQTVSK